MPKIGCFGAFFHFFCFWGPFFENLEPKICFFIHQMWDEISQMTNICQKLTQNWTLKFYQKWNCPLSNVRCSVCEQLTLIDNGANARQNLKLILSKNLILAMAGFGSNQDVILCVGKGIALDSSNWHLHIYYMLPMLVDLWGSLIWSGNLW